MTEYDADTLKDGRTAQKPIAIKLNGEVIEANYHITNERDTLLHLYLGARSDGIDISVPLCSDKPAYARSERGKAALGFHEEVSDDPHACDECGDEMRDRRQTYCETCLNGPFSTVWECDDDVTRCDNPLCSDFAQPGAYVCCSECGLKLEAGEAVARADDVADVAPKLGSVTTETAKRVADALDDENNEKRLMTDGGEPATCPDCDKDTEWTPHPSNGAIEGLCDGCQADRAVAAAMDDVYLDNDVWDGGSHDNDDRRLVTDGGHDVVNDDDTDMSGRAEDAKNDDEQMRIDDFGGRQLLTDGGTDHEDAQKTINVHDENIPKILKDHDRWLLWDASNDTPRRPHWRGNFGISYNDPADWHTFEEALEAAESNPSWGIGFVTTNTNVTVIDLDGCRRTDGSYADKIFKFKWWVPDEFSGGISECFKEFSPSKTGVHLPVIGFDVPDWWSDKSFEDGHEGVDVLDNKFCTVTGMGDGDLPVLDLTDEDAQWLRDALADMYEAITDEDPRVAPDTPSPGYSPGDEWLQPADVQDALGYIDADVGYPEWRNIGFAVAEYFDRVGDDLEDDAFDVALETFEEWSQTGEKWDREAEQNAFNIIKAGFDGGDENDSYVSLGTLLHVAERNGWEMPDKQMRKALQTVDSFIEKWGLAEARREDDDAPDGDEKRKLARAVALLSQEDYESRANAIAIRVPVSTETIERHRELWHIRDEDGKVVNHDGMLSEIGGAPWLSTSPIFNFEFDVESILELPGEDEGRSSTVRVSPSEPNEPEFEIEVEPRVFNDARRFRDTVLSKMYSTVIESGRSDSGVMDLVRQYIAAQDVPVRQGQYEMGLSEDGSEFVTPTGAIGTNGWSDDPGHVYVDRGSKTNAAIRSFSADPEEHVEVDKYDVARMLELAAQSRLPERITPILSWFAAAPFRKLIFEQTATFNPLGVFGRSGSGKTATLAALNQMWGMSNEPLAVNGSKHAVMTGFTSSRGVPIWFDEYRPEKTPDYVMDRWHTWFKKAATGGVEPRGNQSMGTDDWHLRSPIVVSGESEIKNDAERRRSIMVNVTTEPTQDGHPARNAFKDLVGDVTTDDAGNVEFPEAEYELQEFAVAYYSWVTSMSGDEFRAAWYDAREKVAEFAAEHDIDLGDTELQGLQTVVFGHRRLVSFAQTVGADLSKLPSASDLDAALKLVADVDSDGRQPHEHQFLSLVSRAAAAGYIEDATDYRVVHEGKANEELRVNVVRAFDKVSKFARDHDLNEDLLQSASDYKTRFGQLEDEDMFVTVTSQPTQGISRCTGIDMSRGVEEVAGFTRESFVDVDDEGEQGEIVNDNDNDDGGNGPTPVAAVSPYSGTGYDTVTVEVTKWEFPDNNKITARGTVKDGTKPIRISDFDGAAPGDVEPGNCYRIENVVVDEYDNNTQLIVEDGTTEFVPVQRGVGHISPVEAEDRQAVIESASEFAQEPQDTVRADGGEDARDTPQSQRDRVKTIKSVVSTVEAEYDDGAPVGVVREKAEEDGFDMDKFDHVIAKLRKKGDVYEPKDGRLRATEGD